MIRRSVFSLATSRAACCISKEAAMPARSYSSSLLRMSSIFSLCRARDCRWFSRFWAIEASVLSCKESEDIVALVAVVLMGRGGLTFRGMFQLITERSPKGNLMTARCLLQALTGRVIGASMGWEKKLPDPTECKTEISLAIC